MKRILLTLVAGVGLLSWSALDAEALLIDSFDTVQGPVSLFPSPTTITNSVGASPATTIGSDIIGGERDLLVSRSTTDPFVTADVNTSVAGGLFFSASGSATPTSPFAGFMVQWDGVDGGAPMPTPPPEVPYTSTLAGLALGSTLISPVLGSGGFGYDRFRIDVLPSTTPGALLTLTVHGASGSSSLALPTSGGAELLDFYFAGFGGGFDFDSDLVEAITLQGTPGSPGGSIRIGSITALPEPSSIALLGMGAFGLMGYGWRRKKKQAVAA